MTRAPYGVHSMNTLALQNTDCVINHLRMLTLYDSDCECGERVHFISASGAPFVYVN